MVGKAACDTSMRANTLEDRIQIHLQPGDTEEKS